jgi:hypothetical protein
MNRRKKGGFYQELEQILNTNNITEIIDFFKYNKEIYSIPMNDNQDNIDTLNKLFILFKRLISILYKNKISNIEFDISSFKDLFISFLKKFISKYKDIQTFQEIKNFIKILQRLYPSINLDFNLFYYYFRLGLFENYNYDDMIKCLIDDIINYPEDLSITVSEYYNGFFHSNVDNTMDTMTYLSTTFVKKNMLLINTFIYYATERHIDIKKVIKEIIKEILKMYKNKYRVYAQMRNDLTKEQERDIINKYRKILTINSQIFTDDEFDSILDDVIRGGKINSHLVYKSKDGRQIKKKIYIINGKPKVRDGKKNNKIHYIALSTYKKKYP